MIDVQMQIMVALQKLALASQMKLIHSAVSTTRPFTFPSDMNIKPKHLLIASQFDLRNSHFLYSIGDERKRSDCVVCKQQLQKRVRVSTKCSLCGVFLCADVCDAVFHHR